MRWKIGECEFDPITREIRPISGPQLGEPDARLLEILIERYGAKYKHGSKYENNQLITAVWGHEGSDDSLYTSVRKLRDAFGEKRRSYILSKPVRLAVKPEPVAHDELAGGRGIPFKPPDIPRLEQPKRRNTNLSPELHLYPTVSARDLPNKNGFIISLDSMIINSVSELLSNTGARNGIIRRCYRTYRRCLEDFAFAIVYSSQIVSGGILREARDETEEERNQLIQHLGPLWTLHNLEADLRQGQILKHQDSWEGIRGDIQRISRCIKKEKWVFNDWMVYNAQRHLGSHESLFVENAHPESYKYDASTNHYYCDPVLQATLGEPATSILVHYLRGGLQANHPAYADGALRNYVTSHVLTMVSVMREYDMSCEQQTMFRFPHILRSLIQQEAALDLETKQQRHLKNIVVQHCLSTAFRRVDGIERQLLVTELLNLRDTYPFNKIREILENDQLVLARPSRANETMALKIYNEISAHVDSEDAKDNPIDLRRYKVLRQLNSVDVGHYEKELHRVFPELKPLIVAPPM